MINRNTKIADIITNGLLYALQYSDWYKWLVKYAKIIQPTKYDMCIFFE